MAMAQITAIAVLTSRWPKRKAPQMMNGNATNVSDRGAKFVPSPAVRRTAAITNSNPKTATSNFPSEDHRSLLLALQLNISGAVTIMPERSPCHQVHQFLKLCSHDSGWPMEIGINAPVAAIVLATAHSAMNLRTSSP